MHAGNENGRLSPPRHWRSLPRSLQYLFPYHVSPRVGDHIDREWSQCLIWSDFSDGTLADRSRIPEMESFSTTVVPLPWFCVPSICKTYPPFFSISFLICMELSRCTAMKYFKNLLHRRWAVVFGIDTVLNIFRISDITRWSSNRDLPIWAKRSKE